MTPTRSQVLVKHSLHIEIWRATWWKGGSTLAFQSQVAHQEPTKCVRLNWLLVTVKLFQNRRILSRVTQDPAYHASVSSTYGLINDCLEMCRKKPMYRD